MKTKPVAQKQRQAKTEEDLDPTWGKQTGPTVLTRLRSRQLKLENFGYPVLKDYKPKSTKTPIKKEIESKIEVEDGQDEYINLNGVLDQHLPVEVINEKSKSRKLIKLDEVDKTHKDVNINKNTQKVSSRNNSNKENNIILPKKIKGNGNIETVIDKIKKTRLARCKIEAEKIDESTQVVGESNIEPQNPLSPQVSSIEGVEKEIAVSISDKNISSVDEQEEQETKLENEDVQEVDTSLNAKKKNLNSIFYTESNTTEILTIDLVIWGDQIKQAIKSISNYFIVGSKESSSTTATTTVTQNDKNHSNNPLKKIINKPFTRRRAKPKPVQLMTLEEHKKILQACLNSSGKRGSDFKVDSLFRRSMERETRRRHTSQSVYVDTLSTQDGKMILETSTDPKSFRIEYEDGHIIIDDVANYECVDNTEEKGKACSKSKPCNDCDHQRRKRSQKAAVGQVDLGCNWDPQCDDHGKPKCTYTDLIERALAENPIGLTVSEIYNWISYRFPYYSPTDDRWKNSVRHNLSINPYFKKGSKSKSGAGHVWTIAEECQYFRPTLKRRHTAGTLDMTKMKTDTERAVASILGQYSKACADENQNQNELEKQSGRPSETELAKAIASVMEGPSSPPNFQNAAEIHDQQCTVNHMSTIEFSDLTSIMQTSCLLHLEEFTRNGQLVYITQGSEADESNKENNGEPIEYTILESSSFIDATMIPQVQDSTQDLSVAQTQPILSEVPVENIRESFNITGSSIGDSIFGENPLGLSFNYDNDGDVLYLR